MRNHRNYGDVEGLGTGRGWRGGVKTDGTGVYPGILIRNLDSPRDGFKDNTDGGGNGKKLAQRFQAPNPGGGVLTVSMEQYALRATSVGNPPATTIAIQGDAAGVPDGVTLISSVINPSDSSEGWVYLFGPLGGLTPGGFYWIVCDTFAVGQDFWQFEFVNTSTVDEFAAEDVFPAGGWVAQTYRLHYRTAFTWAGAPTSGEYVAVEFDERKINRTRIYSYPSTRILTAQGIETFRVEAKMSGVWTAVDITEVRASDYQNDAPLTVTASPVVSSDDATYFDVFFDEVDATGLRLIITETQTVSDFARLIAVEVFDRVEITDRVQGGNSSIQRDQYLQLDQARLLDLDCANDDRFFSPFYVPLTTQVAAGYHNDEIQSDLLIETEQGFLTNEFVQLGEFYADRFDFPFGQRTCAIQARDFNKFLIRKDMVETIRQNDRLEDLVELCANRGNFSSSRMVLNTTETRVPLFAPTAMKARSVIDELCKAGVLGTLRFDEVGTLRFLTFGPSSMSIGNVPTIAGASVSFTPYGTRFQALAGPVLESITPWSHVLLSGDRAYVSTLHASVGFDTDYQTIIEYDVATRTVLREIITEFANQTLDPTIRYNFANMALDGGFLYCTRKDRALRIDLTTLAITTLPVFTIPLYDRASTYCGLGAIVGGRYYFAYETTAGNVALASCDTATFTTFTPHGILQTGGLRVQRMVVWRPIITVFERIYFAFEDGTSTNSYYDLIGGALVADGLTRRGVTTDGTLLYELMQEVGGQNLLRSRTLLGATVDLGTQPQNTVVASIGPCIDYAGNRIWSIYRSGTNGEQHTLRLFYLLDPHWFDAEMPDIFQTSPIYADRSTGLVLLIEQSSPFGPFSGNPLVYRIRLRMFECPHAPTASVFEASWDDQLLDGQLSVTDENSGESTVLTRVTYTMQPISIGGPIIVWKGTALGSELSPQNPLVIGETEQVGLTIGGPRFVPVPRIAEGFRVPFSTDLAAYPCPVATPGATGPGVTVDSDGVATFGPATNRSVLPFPAAPQSVWWTSDLLSAAISVRLQPHPSRPEMEIIPSGGSAILTSLQVVGTPFLRDAEVDATATSEDVFEDGAEIRARHGDNSVEITNDYIGDVALLQLVGLELIRLFGRPQIQIPSIRIRPLPQLGMEDLIVVKESTTGLQAKLQVVGLSQRFAVSGRSLTVETAPRLVTLATLTTEGTGQGTVTPLPGPPVAE